MEKPESCMIMPVHKKWFKIGNSSSSGIFTRHGITGYHLFQSMQYLLYDQKSTDVFNV